MRDARQNVDEIDAWAERTFGHKTPDTRQKRMRNGMQSEHGRREFDKLFKPKVKQ